MISNKKHPIPQDDCFQIVRPSGPDGKEVYYWPTGFELVRNVPKSWAKGPVVRYPIFQFLTPPVGLGLTVIPAVASGEMNASWASAMKLIRSAAVLEQREFKDMPGLVAPAAPVPAQPLVFSGVGAGMPPLEDMTDDEMPPLDQVGTEESMEGTHWASLTLLMEAAQRMWWQGWRSDGPFRKHVRVLDLDMLEPTEFLHFLRLASSINTRVASSGGKQIALKFTMEEVEKMKTVKGDPAHISEIVQIMSEYIV